MALDLDGSVIGDDEYKVKQDLSPSIVPLCCASPIPRSESEHDALESGKHRLVAPIDTLPEKEVSEDV